MSIRKMFSVTSVRFCVMCAVSRTPRSTVRSTVNGPLRQPSFLPLMKSNAKVISVCANYKITQIFKHLKVDKHPLPRIEDLFVAFQGGGKIQKIKILLMHIINQFQIMKLKNYQFGVLPQGIYSVNRLPFGTELTYSIFQRVIEKPLQGFCMLICQMLF